MHVGHDILCRGTLNTRVKMEKEIMPHSPDHEPSGRGALCAPFMRILLLTCALGLFGAPLGAQDLAQPQPAAPLPASNPTVLLLGVQSPPGQVSSLVTERIDLKLREGMGAQDGLVLMPSYAQIQQDLAGSGQSSALVARAEQLYASGIGLLTAGQNEKARESFSEAVELMTRNLPDVQRYNVLADALVNLALAHHLTGFDLDGRKRMQQYAHLRPGETLNPEKFPPDLVAVYAKEVEKVGKAGPGKLTIEASKPEAAVFIDGAFKGATPLVVEDVGFGEHYVVVRHGDGDVWGQQIRVEGRGKTQDFRADFGATALTQRPAGSPASYEDLRAKIATGVFTAAGLEEALQELSKQTGAPHLSWVVLTKSGSGYSATPFVWAAQPPVLLQGEASAFNVELSNLAIGVNTLSKTIQMLLTQRPAALAVSSVALTQPPALAAATPPPSSPVVLTPPPPPADGGVEQTAILVPPEQEEEQSNTMLYVGAGAGALLLGGLIVGSILLFSDDDAETTAPGGGFGAEVTW